MQTIPAKWYTVLSITLGVEAGFLFGCYLALRFTNFLPADVIGLNVVSAGAALVALIYSLGLYFGLRKRIGAQRAALISHLLTAILVGIIIQTSGNIASPLYFLWIGVVFSAGAFGRTFIGGFALALIFYLAMLYIGNSATTNFNTILLFSIIDILTAGFSWLFWRHFYGSTKDLSGSKKRATNALAAEQLKSEIVINSIADGVVVIDSQGRIQLFNPGAQSITGWKIEDALNINFINVVKLITTSEPAIAIPVNEHPFTAAIRKGESISDDNARLQNTNNDELDLSLVISPIIIENTIWGAVGIFHDVTKLRREERQRAEFISTASHEMRTPVAAIEGYLALALNEKIAKIDSKARDYLQKAHQSTEHLGQLFRDLLTAAKSEDGRLTNHPKVVEMHDFLSRIVEEARFGVEKKGLQLHLAVAGDDSGGHGENVVAPLYQVHIDPERMSEVLTNLINNALKFTDEGEIVVGLRGQEDYIQITVRDSGFGIPPDDIPHLFQKFYRVDNSNTRSIGGTGLGLFISKKIVELYKGKIWVESTYGEGATFYINLPRLSFEEVKKYRRQEESELAPLQIEQTI